MWSALLFALSAVVLAAHAQENTKLGNPLGMTTGAIPDSALTSSSAHGWNWWYYGARNARLYGGHDYGSFIPVSPSASWVQADLQRPRAIGGIATQGRRLGGHWTRTFGVQYSLDGSNWSWYTPPGAKDHTINGNSDANTVVETVFAQPFTARYVRVWALSFEGWPCFRFELYSPFDDDTSGGFVLGISTFQIPDSSFSASSAHGNNWGYYGPQTGRLHSNINWGAWIPQHNRAGEWVQVDLGSPRVVGAIATQGRAGGGYWTTQYSISYSDDGANWREHVDDCNQDAQKNTFVGNENHYEVVKNQLVTPFKARYVRLTVVSFGPNGWPALRWELFAPEAPSHRLGRPLGVSNPAIIPNSQITASSAHGNNWSYYGPGNARLSRHINWGGWIPQYNSDGEWVQVDLGKVTEVGGIATQGSASGSYYLTTFDLIYSLDGSVWHSYMMRGAAKTFRGNTDAHSVREHVFSAPFQARFVRVVARSFPGWPALRFELYGPSEERLKLGREFIGAPQGMESGAIASDRIKASSVYPTADGSCNPENARLNGAKGVGAWCAGANTADQWIQVEMDPQVPVGGFGLQARNLKGDVAQGWRQFVTNYRVAYSNDGQTWTTVKRWGSDRVFMGNMDSTSVQIEAINGHEGIKAKFFRILPGGWFTHISLRFEVYNTARYENEVVKVELAKKKAAEEEAARKAKEEAERVAAEKKAAAEKAEAEKKAIAAAEEAAHQAEMALRNAATASARAAAKAAVEEAERKAKALEDAKTAQQIKAKNDAAVADSKTKTFNAAAQAAETRLATQRFLVARVRRTKEKTAELNNYLSSLLGDIYAHRRRAEQAIAERYALDQAIAVLTRWIIEKGDLTADEEGSKIASQSGSNSAGGENSETSPAESDEECACAAKLASASSSSNGTGSGSAIA